MCDDCRIIRMRRHASSSAGPSLLHAAAATTCTLVVRLGQQRERGHGRSGTITPRVLRRESLEIITFLTCSSR